KNLAPVYNATVIMTPDEQKSTETYLLKSIRGQRVRVDVRTDYVSGREVAEYRVNDGKSVKVTLELPGKGTTKADRLKEYKAHPELLNADIPVTVEVSGQV